MSLTPNRSVLLNRKWVICLLLAATILAVYWPVKNNGFVDYDDNIFVIDNAQVNGGLSWASLRWALTASLVGNWHPVTTLSHIIDCQLFGVNPGAHHLVSLSLHIAAVLVLFLALTEMTGARWRSAVVAALFGLHPLRVESVAWVSERKDVLSGLFFMLTLWAYGRYVRRRGREDQGTKGPKDQGTGAERAGSEETEGGKRTLNIQHSTSNGERRTAEGTAEELSSPRPSPPGRGGGTGIRPSARWYLLALLFFALGLMSKPMLVTLPFVLLLLDFWPLGRLATPKRSEGGLRLSTLNSQPSTTPATLSSQLSTSLPPLIFEKLPFFLLAGALSIVTFLVQRSCGAVVSLDTVPMDARLANAVVSYWRYLAKLVWPAGLAPIYPHPAGHFFLSAQWPAFEVWSGALLLVAVSVLLVGCAWSRPYFAVGWFWFLGMMVPVIGLVQVGDAAMADRYTYLPLIGPVLALVWWVAGLRAAGTLSTASPLSGENRDAVESVPTLKGGMESVPSNRKGLALGGLALAAVLASGFLTRRQISYWRNTVSLFEHTVAVTADNPGAEFSLGVGLERAGHLEQAMVHYRVALAINPHEKQARLNLGLLLQKQSYWQPAADAFFAVLRDDPSDLTAQVQLGNILPHLGRAQEGVWHLQAALRLRPDTPELLNNLAWLLATSPQVEARDGAEAVTLAQRACELTHHRQVVMLGTLAAAYAEAGQFSQAVATAQQACDLAAEQHDEQTLKRNRELLDLYRAGHPYRDEARVNRY